MVEHRLIERVIALWKAELESIRKTGRLNPGFIDSAVDFMVTYADRCHHGKEEDILFKRLKEKKLPAELKNILDELIREHVVARKTVAEISRLRQAYPAEDANAAKEVFLNIETIVGLYPPHIEKEDRRFFLPCMAYFDEREKQAMLEEFREFDRLLIHEKYKSVVSIMEVCQKEG